MMVVQEPKATLARTCVIGVGNQKGGVAKTTNTLNLAAALAEMGRSVLLMDCDANCGVTRALGIPLDDFPGSHEIMLGDEKPEDVYLANGDSDLSLPENLFVIPSRRKLNKIMEELATRNSSKFSTPSASFLLRAPVQELAARHVFDYIFLDTGPQTPPPTLSTYMAVDWFLLSAFPERDAIEGLEDAMIDIRDAQQNGNPTLQVLGVITSAVDRRTNIARRLQDFLSEKFMDTRAGESRQLTPPIPSSVVVKNAREKCQTVIDYSPKHKVADAYRELARNVEARLAPFVSSSASPAVEAEQGVANA